VRGMGKSSKRQHLRYALKFLVLLVEMEEGE
jgi:hypothetical protein